jgi:hypothetical protein
MELHLTVAPMFAANCYMIIDGDAGQGAAAQVVGDGGAISVAVRQELARHGLSPADYRVPERVEEGVTNPFVESLLRKQIHD